MTNEQINIVIAEACGYEWVSNGWGCRFLGSPTEKSFGPDTQSPLCEDAYGGLPDYCNCLNAMHEAEKVLNKNQWVAYGRELSRLNVFPMVHATARQRAEAFLRTLGKQNEKWEEQ
jgi:hypothetical protein